MEDIVLAKKYCALYSSAKTRQIEFTLTLKKLRNLLKAKRCFYTGIPFEETGDYARTIDRVNSNLGYTDENTVACSNKINSLKGNLSEEEIIKMAENLKKFTVKSVKQENIKPLHSDNDQNKLYYILDRYKVYYEIDDSQISGKKIYLVEDLHSNKSLKLKDKFRSFISPNGIERIENFNGELVTFYGPQPYQRILVRTLFKTFI